eukprot:CAMPEP_0113663824 /NCGR_PEP_ID=MMETSP0038_2-20120614/1378_1 /TAXON_ID=2898 /ORGANISM="Cryptomonas paramecium" /LENGTH=146 /DNA_ID=CAMNT_0000578937 /DNA_START=10 /DNA_END=450 /DNA_ORIENTATION=- /assembly_acc=CAM_ASM_000170
MTVSKSMERERTQEHSATGAVGNNGVRDVLIEGVLEKQGRWNKCWKQRYFVLESSGRMYYYQSESSKWDMSQAIKVIPIDCEAKITFSRQDKRNIIEIRVPSDGSGKRCCFLSTDDEITLEKWRRCLTSAQSSILFTTCPLNVRSW